MEKMLVSGLILTNDQWWHWTLDLDYDNTSWFMGTRKF